MQMAYDPFSEPLVSRSQEGLVYYSYSVLWAAVLCLTSCCTTFSWGQTSRPVGQDLFQKEIVPGETVVVTREPLDLMQLGVLGEPLTSQHATTALIRVELRMSNGSVATLASTLQSEFPDSPSSFDVLGAFPGTGELVVVAVFQDSVGLWRIPLALHRMLDGWAWVRPEPQNAAIVHFKPGELSVSMSQLPKRRWALTITDKRSPTTRTIDYEQIPGAWQFAAIPTTRPSSTRPIGGQDSPWTFPRR
jgi:hypothetical protein